MPFGRLVICGDLLHDTRRERAIKEASNASTAACHYCSLLDSAEKRAKSNSPRIAGWIVTLFARHTVRATGQAQAGGIHSTLDQSAVEI